MRLPILMTLLALGGCATLAASSDPFCAVVEPLARAHATSLADLPAEGAEARRTGLALIDAVLAGCGR